MNIKKTIILLCMVITINAMSQCWSKISSGLYHTLAIKTDDTQWARGDNAYGQLGDGTFIDKITPIQICTANNWRQIRAVGFKKII